MDIKHTHSSGVPPPHLYPRAAIRAGVPPGPFDSDLNYAGRHQDFRKQPQPQPVVVHPPTLRQLFYHPRNLQHLFNAFIGYQRAHRKHIPADLKDRFGIWLRQWGENSYLDQSPRGHATYVSDSISLRDENKRFIAFYADPVADLGAAIADVNDRRMPKSQMRQDGPYAGARGAPHPVRVGSGIWKAVRAGSSDVSSSDGRLSVHPRGDFSLLLEGMGHSEPYQGPDGIQRRKERLEAEAKMRERVQQRQIRDTVDPMREPLVLDLAGGRRVVKDRRGNRLTHEDYEAVSLPLQTEVTMMLPNTSGRYVKSASRALHASSRGQWADETLSANFSRGCIIPAKRTY